MLWDMMCMGGYTNQSQEFHSTFFARHIASSLGPHPGATGASDSWESFMTDDHTPIELSWNWAPSRSGPSVRYSVDPIEISSGSILDPFNTQASIELLQKTMPYAAAFNLQWYEHFTKALTVSGKGLRSQDVNSSKIPRSQQFLAFELLDDEIMTKVYFLPQWKAKRTRATTLEVVENAVHALGTSDPSMSAAMDVITDYICSFPLEERPEVEIVAIDCIDPSKSRIKIYLRSRRTTFDSVIDMMTLGGRLPAMTGKGQASLEELWCSVLSLDNADMDLPETTHRTAGILYYLELRADSPLPKSKVYIPAKHYGKDDLSVARGLSKFLGNRDQYMADGSDYLDGVTRICKHRKLEDGRGFHTYISCAVSGDDLNVTSYYNPEIYHASRGHLRS
ncbi:aromatic prenyltransferase [Mytilinidion resinicola]|uniref:Aromatic prenyltransferase n=1 Tax=Mytilinidion resinicola TaxID=574789 RepID=A0A6A6Z2U8_9PEZI|nr:aromatic prenyltransferase [Mytilinidion resinicola]KAF2815492.1 aromatic prenyltransferase [Mytilinidion resinicola]